VDSIPCSVICGWAHARRERRPPTARRRPAGHFRLDRVLRAGALSSAAVAGAAATQRNVRQEEQQHECNDRRARSHQEDVRHAVGERIEQWLRQALRHTVQE